MAVYGGSPADFGVQDGQPVPGAAFEVWDAATGGTRLTGLVDHTGAATAQAVGDAYGALRFEVPGRTGDVYVIGEGAPAGAPRLRLSPADLTARLTALETGAGAGTDQVLAGRVDAAEDALGVLDGRADAIEGTHLPALGERVDVLDGRVDAIEGTALPGAVARLDEVEAGVDGLSGRLASVEGETIPGLDARLDSLEAAAPAGGGDAALAGRVDGIDGRLTVVEGETIPALDARVDALEAAPAPAGGTDGELATRVDGIDGRLTTVETEAVPALTGRIDGLESGLDETDARADDLDTRVASVEDAAAALPALDGRVDAVEDRLGGLEARPDLSGRVEAAETAVAALDTRLDGVQGTDLPALDARLDGLEARPDLSGRVDALEAAVAPIPDLSARLDGVEAVQGDLDARVRDLESAPAPSGGGLVVVTSASRPATPAPGTMIYETDTGRVWTYTDLGGWAGWVPQPGTAVFQASSGAGQSVPSAVSVPVLFDEQTLNLVGSPASSDRFSPTVPGTYFISGGIGYVPNSTGYRNGGWTLNGVNAPGGATSMQASAVGNTAMPVRAVNTYLNGRGDYVQLTAYHNAGTVVALSNNSGYRPVITVVYAGR